MLIPDHQTSTILVTASCGNVRDVGARCQLSGQNQSAVFLTPARIQVGNSLEPLSLFCSGDMLHDTSTYIMPRPNLAVLGNVLIGGVVGAAVDTVTGRGLSYPPVVHVHSAACR